MTREEVHKTIDRILNTGYCGEITIESFRGAVSVMKLKEQAIKSPNDLLVVTSNA